MLYFIVNPAASSGKGLAVWEKVKTILDEHQAEYESIFLEGPGEAGHIASALCKGDPCTAVVVGGDGTINEFLQGINDPEKITFTSIPTGSGNDFARGMRLPSNPKDAVDMILSAKNVRNVNIGTVSDGEHERRFIVSAGIGFDAAVCYASHSSSSKRFLNHIKLGNLTYTINALIQIFSMEFMHTRLVLDDTQILSFDKTYFIAAMNTRYEGGGFMFAPKASPVDNELDLFVVEGIPRWKVPFILPTAYGGHHTGYKGVHLFRCKKAVVQCTPDSCVHTDGEHFDFVRKLTFSLKPERLKTIVD